jgi:Gpi18-like mannosyltransferase
MDGGRWIELALFAGLLLCAFLLRYLARPYVSRDYTSFLAGWYEHLQTHAGFAGLKDTFANYNVPYLYLLAGLTYVPVYPLTGIKAISSLFDVLLAVFVYRIVALRYTARWVPRLSAVAVLLLPTVFLNSAVWGQCASIYAAFAVAGVYYLIVRRPWLACFLFGVAFSFKLQTIFVFPLLLAAVAMRYIPWRSLVAIPAAYVALAIPAALLGHSLRDLFLVYVDQANSNTYLLTFNAPTVYQLIRPATGAPTLSTVGTIFAAAIALLPVLLAVRSGQQLTADRVVVLGLISVLTTVFFLPGMHERYFYLADVLSLVAMFLIPRLWPVPLLMQFASGFAYVPFLFGRQGQDGVSIDQRVLAIAILAAMIVTGREFVRQFDLVSVLRTARTDPGGSAAPVTPLARENRYRPNPVAQRPSPSKDDVVETMSSPERA